MKLKLKDIDPDQEYDGWVEFFHRWIFDEIDRKLLQRFYLDGISYGDLAEEFNMDFDTVRTRMRKARNEFFKHL